MDASPSENAITKKKKSSRRSSILKRRPLGNMNMNEELKDRASLLPSKRRVSFAACNEMREICEHTTDLSAHVKIPAVLLPEDKQALNSDSAQQDLVLAQDDRASSQTSTPVAAKHPKRMSLAFSRLSIIPPDGGAAGQDDDSGSALLLDPEGPGGCEGQFPPPPSLRQLETIVGPSDSLHGDQVSMELTCVEPHGESLQPVSNDGDHSMDADDFVAYEDHSNDLPQSVPRRLDDAAVELGNQALGEKLPTCDDSSVPTTYSSASGGVRDLVQRKCESLAVVDMSLDLSCTSSPRQPCIHPHLIDVVGGDRSANNQENSPIKNDMELEDGHLQTDASKDTSHAIQPDASNMSLTCQTPMLSRVGLLKVDGSEGTHTLQMQASNDTSHAIQPEVSNMSLIHQPLMLGRDEAPKENGGNVPADTLNHTTPPNSPSMSLTCEAPLHNGDGAQDTRHTTVLGSSQIDRDVVVVASMAQAPATFNSSVTELTCKIPAIPPLMPQDCSTGSHTSSNASPMSQGSHTVTPGNCLPDKDDADVQQEGRSRVLRQSPAGERPKTQLASVTTVKPPTVSTSTDDPPSRAQLSNSLPLSTSVAISDTHRLPKIGLTRQSKRIRPSTRALKKRISVPRSLTASKVSALAQVNYSASILHSSAAATLPYTDSALAPAVKDETASKADNLEHHAEAVGSGSEEEAAATSQGNRSASVKEMTQQDVKEDRIKHPQEVTEDIREGLPVDHVAEMGCERVTDYDSVQNGGHTGVQDRTDMSVQDNTCTSVQDRMDTSVQDRTRTCVQDRTDMFVQDRTRTCVQDRTDMFVQDRTNTSVQDKMDTSVKDKMDTSVKDKMDTSVQDRTDTSVQDRTRMCVQDRTHLCVQEGTDTSVQDRTHTSVQEGTHASMRVGQNTSVLEGEHRLTPSDEGIPRQKDECTPSFSKTYTLSTLPGGCLSPTDGQLESVTTVVGGSSNDSESRISAKQDEGESLCSSTTAPLDATREVPHRCRHLNRTYSISPDSSFFSAKEDDSWKEETFSSPLPVETASLVTVTAAPLPSGTTHLCPSPCLSEGNWMHGKDADISLVDSSMITLLADRTLTPQVQLKTTVGGNLEEEVKNAVAAPVCTALTTTTPPSDTGVNEQGISTERPTEDVGTTHRCHANPNDVSRCSVTEGTLNTTHRRHANPNDVSGCSVTEGTLNTTHRRHANPNDVSGCSIIEGTLNTTHRRHANPNDVSGCRVTEGTLNTTHRRHANPNDVSGCSVTEGTLNTTLQSAGYDSPLLQVFKTPGGGTPGTLLKSKISFVTTPWSARSSFTPIIPDRSTPGSTAPSRLWVDLPVLVTMENAPEFFNVDCAEVKALDKAEALKRLAVGYQELHTVLQSDEGQALDPSTIDARLLQAGLNCAMEGMGHLYALMKYQERYCGKLFPWPLEDQVTSVYDPIEVSFEAGDRLHWIARKRVEMELLLRQAKALMRGTPKAYRWLIHSWTKDVIRILFLQPLVAVTVNVLPSCEIGSHMIDADISLNVADYRITSKDAFILDKYSVQGSLPKVAAEVLLKVAALCQDQRPKLS